MTPVRHYLKGSMLLTVVMIFKATTVNATTFYSKGNLAANTRTNWTTSPINLLGLSPTTTQWGESGHTYIVRSGDHMTTNAAWNHHSNLQINEGGSLTVGTNNSWYLTIQGTTSVSGTLVVRNTSVKTFTGAFTVDNGGIFTITGNQTVMNSDLTVAAGGVLDHHNNYDDASVYLQVNGNLSIDGTYNYSGYTPVIWMNGTGTRYIRTGTTSLCKLLLRGGNFYANGTVTINEEFYAMWNQVGGSFHTNGQNVNANGGVVNNGGAFYVDGGTLKVSNTIGGMLIGRTLTQNGSLHITAGVINISGGGIYLGTPSAGGPAGTATQSGGTLNIDILDIGRNSSFTQTGGTNNINGSLNLNHSSSLYSQGASTLLNIAGNLTNNGVYSTSGAVSAALKISGSLINNQTFTTTPASTVTFNGGGNSTISGSASTTFYNLNVDKSVPGATVVNGSADKSFNVNNDLGISSGNLLLQAGDNDYNFSKNVTVAANSTFTHSVAWDGTGKKISIGGSLDVSGIFNPTVRSHVQLNGSGVHTLQTGNNAASTLSILTLINGNFTASGNLKSNQEAWVMFGANGTFTTNGKNVTFGGLANNQGTINVDAGSLLTVNGATEIGQGGSVGLMNLSGGTLNLNGNLTIGTAGIINCTNSPLINITGNWINSGAITGSFSPANSTVTFRGWQNQTIDGTRSTTFNNLVINPSSGITVSSVSNNISIVNDLTVSTGIFDLTTFTCNRTVAGGNFILASGTILKAAGANNFPQAFTNALHASSTTEYYGTVAQSVYPTTYGHLTLSNSSTKTAAGIVSIAGNLNINSSAIFAGSSYAHTIAGQWYNNVSASAYSGGTSTFTFNGSALQTIGGTAATTFNRLTINNLSGVNISQDQTVNSTLTLTAGRLNIGTKNLTMGSSAPAIAGTFSATRMIIADGGGEVRKNYSANGAYFFPIGDMTGTTEYSPISLNFTLGTFTAGAFTGVKVTNLKHPQNNSTNNFLRRYWTVSNGGITSPSFTATATYVPADIAGTATTIAAAKYTGALPWVKYGVIGVSSFTTIAITNTGTAIAVTGITNQVPVAAISGGGVSICLGNSASLSSSVSNNGTGSITYSWSPATELSATNISNPVATPSINRTYSLLVTDGNGITSSAVNSSLNVTIPPSAAIAYPGSPYCYNSGVASINISGSSSGSFAAAGGISLNASTGAVNLATSAPGSYTVSYEIAAAGGCPLYTTTAQIKINPNTWTGGTSTDWNTGSNWAASHEAGCPDITILSGAYKPLLTSGVISMRNLIIMPGAGITLNNTATLQVSGTISNSGIFDAIDGSIEMNGTSAQTLAAHTFKNNAVNHLIINNSNSSGVSIGGELDIYGSLTYKGSGRVFHTNDNLTLKSNSVNTAWVGDMTGHTITGKVTVERYNSAHKAWRFLSVPTNTTQTVKETWQEGGTGNTHDPVPGFGAQLTGAGGLAAGFDLYTATPSIKTYNPLTHAWEGIANTHSTNIKSAQGYMVLIRGNRTSNAYTSPATETVLRTKGTLFTGNIGPIAVLPGKLASIGNPYASPVDFTKISRTNGVDNKFYVWDPFISGYYNLGGYQIMSATNNWEPVPGGSLVYPSGVQCTTIQSGQAFFVHATTVPGFVPQNYEVTFSETSKVSGNGLAGFARPQGPSGIKTNRQFFKISLFTGPLPTDVIADGNVVAFDESFSNNLDGSDAQKIMAGGENFDIKSGGNLLAIEARAIVNSSDTIHYNMSKLARKTYQLRIAPVNMESSGLDAVLIDRFLQTHTPVSLTDSSFINITITAEAASSAADRFKVVFKQMAVLPVTITKLNAVEKNKNISVNWKVENEINISHYEIEKSLNGTHFSKAEIVHSTSRTGEYQWLDENVTTGTHYYRLRSVDMNGKTSLTQIVKVLIYSPLSEMTIYPNPVIRVC